VRSGTASTACRLQRPQPACGSGDGGVRGRATLQIADHNRWRSVNMLQGYVRDVQALDAGNPPRTTGL
jgi:hypothetical protein